MDHDFGPIFIYCNIFYTALSWVKSQYTRSMLINLKVPLKGVFFPLFFFVKNSFKSRSPQKSTFTSWIFPWVSWCFESFDPKKAKGKTKNTPNLLGWLICDRLSWTYICYMYVYRIYIETYYEQGFIV